ncbi:hypothetical protein [Bathymodiolus azoricus thioautotrophic gill symbiont]|uniref:Uncharacterized protein n=1 Tax=Bathymodiolus azoricus thioautotrophic gill symbiont TaxID=235205 RepID=A0A1H6M9U2_9GAMM|nr:hypothetical protein [Bathymodiolus azoricus thioautotrophic gill symbiont]SEH94468.1 conserved hypothetical protein [Bathymodiolus azoricus thioautotrophic gill symbiont]
MSDLSTHLTLENDTPYTLDLASKSIDHGHWTTDPPSTIDTLKASPFTLTDDSAAAAGSEGTVVYSITVSDTNEEGGDPVVATFTVRFCCSYSVDNNYCYFSTSNPKLFAIHFRVKIGEHGVWHDNYCPEGGHPVYAELFIRVLS